ncbi:MAG TPA: type II toxin-antitoxin system HicA family toxin [Candidatus Kapabacteria bacterium]|nr:type II toxin-antitoxin system HicA family toxin [Candidatus Kapabacteria bacterium]
MKRKQLISFLQKNNCILFREGGNHSVYINLELRKSTTVPRHNEINDYLVRKICKDLGIKSPF